MKKKYNVVLLVVKFVQIKKNYFSVHRPHQFKKKISYKNFKIQIRNFLSKKDIKDLKYVLIGGAGLIDEKKIILNKIINCHSGLIPESRGLDSVKWSIFKQNLVGNTLHFINDEIDKGEIIHQEITKFKSKCSLKQFYKIHYEKEIKMLINFEKHLINGKKIELRTLNPTKRFPKKNEKEITKKFSSYKKNFKFLTKKLKIKKINE